MTRRAALTITLIVVLAGLGAGCSQTRTVEFYKTHPALRALKTDKCVAVGTRTDDCRNAVQASFDVLGVPARDGVAITPATAAR